MHPIIGHPINANLCPLLRMGGKHFTLVSPSSIWNESRRRWWCGQLSTVSLRRLLGLLLPPSVDDLGVLFRILAFSMIGQTPHGIAVGGLRAYHTTLGRLDATARNRCPFPFSRPRLGVSMVRIVHRTVVGGKTPSHRLVKICRRHQFTMDQNRFVIRPAEFLPHPAAPIWRYRLAPPPPPHSAAMAIGMP